MEGGPPMFNPGFTGPDLLNGLWQITKLQGFHLLRLRIPTHSQRYCLSAFARRYLRSRMLLSFPMGTEMFQFPTFASTPYAFRCR